MDPKTTIATVEIPKSKDFQTVVIKPMGDVPLGLHLYWQC